MLSCRKLIILPGRACCFDAPRIFITNSLQNPARSQHTTVRLPLLDVLFAIDRSLRLIVAPILGDLLDPFRNEGCQL